MFYNLKTFLFLIKLRNLLFAESYEGQDCLLVCLQCGFYGLWKLLEFWHSVKQGNFFFFILLKESTTF